MGLESTGRTLHPTVHVRYVRDYQNRLLTASKPCGISAGMQSLKNGVHCLHSHALGIANHPEGKWLFRWPDRQRSPVTSVSHEPVSQASHISCPLQRENPARLFRQHADLAVQRHLHLFRIAAAQRSLRLR